MLRHMKVRKTQAKNSKMKVRAILCFRNHCTMGLRAGSIIIMITYT